MLEYCVTYARILLMTITFFILQNACQSFLVTAERPKTGLFLTIGAGVTNMILDFLFVAVFQWGISGAALATSVSQIIGGLVPFLYFLRPNDSPLKLVRTRIEGKVLLKTCTNGSSEMLTNISASLVSMLYNYQLMRLVGADGVAAYGVIMYINTVFSGVFFGYSIGSASIVGYHYGAENHAELKSLFQKSMKLISIWSVSLTVLAILFSSPLSKIFVSYDAGLLELTVHGFRLYALSFLIMGFNVFGSAFFTALNNGAISAVISFLRTLVLQILAILILPIFFKIDGLWLAVAAAETITLIITIAFFVTKRKQYHY